MQLVADFVKLLQALGLSEAEAKAAAEVTWEKVAEMRKAEAPWSDTEKSVAAGESDYPDGGSGE